MTSEKGLMQIARSKERNRIENDNKKLAIWRAFCYISFTNACIAQLVEHTTDTREVPGSIPGARTKSQIFCTRDRRPEADRAEAGSSKNSAEFYA